MTSIEALVANTCHCTEEKAREYIDDELRWLREVRDSGDLRYADLEVACSDLGIENDYVEYFLSALG